MSEEQETTRCHLCQLYEERIVRLTEENNRYRAEWIAAEVTSSTLASMIKDNKHKVTITAKRR
jgi:hypothetical protein